MSITTIQDAKIISFEQFKFMMKVQNCHLIWIYVSSYISSNILTTYAICSKALLILKWKIILISSCHVITYLAINFLKLMIIYFQTNVEQENEPHQNYVWKSMTNIMNRRWSGVDYKLRLCSFVTFYSKLYGLEKISQMHPNLNF